MFNSYSPDQWNVFPGNNFEYHQIAFPGHVLQTFQVDLMTFVKLYVTTREVVAHDTHHIYRAKETGGHGGVAGGTAQQAGIFGFRGLNRVERGRANNQYTHISLMFCGPNHRPASSWRQCFNENAPPGDKRNYRVAGAGVCLAARLPVAKLG